MIVELTLLKVVAGISPIKIFSVCAPHLIAAIVMGAIGHLMLTVNTGIVWQIISVLVCIAIYFASLLLWPKSRRTMKDIWLMLVER